MGAVPMAESEVGAQFEHTHTEDDKSTLTADKIMYLIKANWHYTKPRWAFYPDIEDASLDGLVDNLKFAAVTINSKSYPLRMRYTFHVQPKHIIYTDVKLFELTDVINKKRIFHRGLTMILLGRENIISDGEVEVS